MQIEGVRVISPTLTNALLTVTGPEWIRMGQNATPWLDDGAAVVVVVKRNDCVRAMRG